MAAPGTSNRSRRPPVAEWAFLEPGQAFWEQGQAFWPLDLAFLGMMLLASPKERPAVVFWGRGMLAVALP